MGVLLVERVAHQATVLETIKLAHETTKIAHETTKLAHETIRQAHETITLALVTFKLAHETTLPHLARLVTTPPVPGTLHHMRVGRAVEVM